MTEPICWTPELAGDVHSWALDAGFHLAGVSGAVSAEEGERFKAWIAAGRAGDMEYLKRRDSGGSLLRSGLRVAIPWARSVVVCALNYGSGEIGSLDQAPANAAWIARYACSGRSVEPMGDGPREIVPTDYHGELLARLRTVEARLRQRVDCETKCYVDTGPIVERGFAAMAGVGWIGKNTCVINQEVGSWLLLGVIVTSLPVAGKMQFDIAADRCGRCTRCIDACPTDALVAPREMDASRCIAYLTIEKKGPIDERMREAIGRQVFGCDICQDVCPWNSRRPGRSQIGANRSTSVGVTAGMEPRRDLINPTLSWLAEMDAGTFKQWFRGSPLERTGRKRLHRNVAIAMGNSGQKEFLAKLRQWSEGDDEVLAEAASWAIDRIRSASIEG